VRISWLRFAGSARVRLAIVILGIVPAFVLTFLLVSRYKAQRVQFAREWTVRGERDMKRSPAAAVADFETALAYGPDDAARRLRLAEALTASGARHEARAHLLTLWAQTPGDGRLNVDLARLAAADGDVTEATRYYHAAIDGAWDIGAAAARRTARVELAALLLRAGQPVHAQAELIALVDDLPPDAALITRVGRMLVDAGAESRSIPLFERARALDRKNGTAALLEGEVQFRARRYTAAHQLLAEAKHDGATLSTADETMLAASARIPELDALAERLTVRQRLARARQGLTIAHNRLARCQAHAVQPDAVATVADLSNQADALDRLSARALARDPDRITDLVALVAAIEGLPSSLCGTDTADDRALQQIAIDHQLPIK
jgi:tetratricopeptide (TPR) repeat protein